MKFSSDLLFRLSQGTVASELDGGEQSLEVPAGLLPSIRLIGPTPRMVGFGTGDIQRESFFHHFGLGAAASTAQQEGRIVTFGAGLWRVVVSLSSLSNFNQPSDATSQGIQVLLRDLNGIGKRVYQHFAVNGVPQHSTHSYEWLFLEDAFHLVLLLLATGVGQTAEAEARVSGSRLL